MLAAAAAVSIVEDAGAPVPEGRVIEADEHERFTVQQSAQPVPSTGAADPR